MRNLKILVSTTAILVALTGCATHENFVKQQDAWNGKNISSYIEAAGYPDSSYDLPNGNKVYTYTKKEYSGYNSGFSVGIGGMFGHRIGRNGYIGVPFGFPMGYGYDNTEVVACKLFIETDKSGNIIRWSSKGHGCVANEIKNSTATPQK